MAVLEVVGGRRIVSGLEGVGALVQAVARLELRAPGTEDRGGKRKPRRGVCLEITLHY